MQNSIAKLTLTAFASGALLFGAQAALAQQDTQQDPAPATQSQAAPMEVDDQTVSNFVKAYTDVREIHNEYATKLQNAEEPEKVQSLQQEAQQKMEEAVTQNDITVDEYQRIAQQIGQDAQLRSRIQAELQSQQQS